MFLNKHGSLNRPITTLTIMLCLGNVSAKQEFGTHLCWILNFLLLGLIIITLDVATPQFEIHFQEEQVLVYKTYITWAIHSILLQYCVKQITILKVVFELMSTCTHFIKREIDLFYQLGSVAGPVIEANARLEFEDGLRTGVLLHFVTR